MEVPNSFQGHPLSDEQWMSLIDKTLEELGFRSTVCDRCIHTGMNSEGTILVMRWVDDFRIGTTVEAMAQGLAKQLSSNTKKKTCQPLSLDWLMFAMGWR